MVLENVPDRQGVGNFRIADDPAGIGFQCSRQDVQDGGLAAPVGAHDSEDLSLSCLKAYISKSPELFFLPP